MKKILPLLLCALLPLTGCLKEGTFYYTNMQSVVVYNDGKLVSTDGNIYTVTENTSGTSDWKVEGRRYFAIFDILNTKLEIKLTFLEPMELVEPQERDPEAEYPEDPVILEFAQITYNYLDLGISYYKAAGTSCPHDIAIYSELDENKKTLHVFVYHDGNGEDPSRMSEKDLNTGTRFYSLSLEGCEFNQLDITTYILYKDGDKLAVKEYTYTR